MPPPVEAFAHVGPRGGRFMVKRKRCGNDKCRRWFSSKVRLTYAVRPSRTRGGGEPTIKSVTTRQWLCPECQKHSMRRLRRKWKRRTLALRPPPR